MSTITAARLSPSTVKTDLIVRFFFEDKELFHRDRVDLRRIAGEDLLPEEPLPFSGKDRQSILLFPKKMKTQRLLLVGCGKHEGFSAERLRRAAGIAARAARDCRAKDVVVDGMDRFRVNGIESTASESPAEAVGRAAAEGILLGLYQFSRYWTSAERKLPAPATFRFVTDSDHAVQEYTRGIRYATTVCGGTILARDLENTPACDMDPETLASVARKTGAAAGFSVKALGPKEIEKLRMGGLMGVSRGSHKPARFIIMTYKGPGSPKRPTVLVGKGVTFDSGGISIKPAANMGEMKADMSGAAAVIGTMRSIATLKLPVHVVGLVPATENMPGGSALKPGDILTHLNGMTSEVDNTDAEGRLILADALAYGARLDPVVMIDLATLTGAVVVALGHLATGMLGTAASAMAGLREAGLATYERVWELPLWDEYDPLIKSEVADVKNVGGRWGGAITGAMFLKKFTAGKPWVHLDIAGTAIMEETTEYINRGGSGVGVRLLTDFLKNRMGSLS
jgi:leucyl aminopeptidase